MPDQITVTSTVTLANGNLKMQRTGNKKITQAAARAAGNVQVIGTTAVAVTIPTDIGTIGVCWFQNLDAGTAYIELGTSASGAFTPFAKIKAGEAYPIRLSTNAPYARASVAGVSLDLLVLAD